MPASKANSRSTKSSLERYDDDDDEDEMGDKLVAPHDFSGPTGSRHCTDVLCTLLLIASWALMTMLGIYSIMNGDYRIIIYPLDYDGNICGTDYAKNFTEWPYLFLVNNYGGGVCVKECPVLQNVTTDDKIDIRSMITYDGMWQTDGAELPAGFVDVANYSDSEDVLSCTDDLCFPNNDPVQSWKSTGINQAFGFAYYVGDSYAVLSRCFLTLDALIAIQDTTNATTTLDRIEAGYEFWNNLYADLWTSRAYVLGFGFGLSLFVSFCYVMLLRLPGLLNMVIWTSLLIANTMFFVAGAYAYRHSKMWAEQDPPTYDQRAIDVTLYGSYASFGVGVLLLLLLCCLRRHIQLAIGCVKQAGRAIARMPLIVLVPILQAIGLIAFMCVFTVYAVYLASLGHVTVKNFPVPGDIDMAVRTYEFDEFVERCGWYLLFCLFWTGNFIVAVGDMVVSMAVAKWYFTHNKREASSVYVISSVFDTCFYHLGTCAYGSLILAIVQLMRAILARIQKQAKKANSKVADCLLCCCQCCLWCFEKCIKFLNKNAYIQTAIFGTSFCTSAREAFFLILRNAGRIGAISYVSGLVLFVGKLFISSVTTILSYFVIVEYVGEELYSVAGPVVVVFIISYFISDMFMDIFDMGISTILQCFVADEEMFDGDTCYAEGELQKWIDNYDG
uniref:Choline transporter-like protein n=2 Tax=Grammatophora oceanica TaxID=210454 RepID=A0A7S1VN07_9STRA|mmetsp:Transcript_50968/g.76222  ORF Transcript_50968/g.76222 Transcript_50968/m.76222 type:complete len:672 (+) Transcript_50968:165-2180(+)|eukprot:CAMPEP_0194047076 /NCGR_PEP_ID=MMETSP0009_2-20130614/23545_1 /TAXON_ID=210454 /ORGANISM="Grammatophora oceanica, Strain CCMP 410" /LENGTH=671 /DNA_ID=CAMNT_0038692591 /DNA_START=162 /DNA_END=2177 /DNA_ORIENTATION=-